MVKRHHNLNTGICILLLAALPAAGQVAPDEAAQAFYDGDYDRALELYASLLAQQPDNIEALHRSGLMLSWTQRFDESLDHYTRLLQIRPDHPEVLLEQAKVLSWAGRYPESISAFRDLLQRDPQNLTARLSLGNVLAWDGRYEESREVFAAILEDRPGNVAARTGTARTYAWAGRLSRARQWYREVLRIDPGNKDAELGLAYAALWSGDAARADQRARELEQRFPGDKEVAELRQRTRAATAPWVLAHAGRLDDSDEIRLRTYDVSTGWTVAGLRVGGGLIHYAMTDPQARASIDSLFGTLALRPGQGQQVDLRIAVDRNDGATGERDTKLLGSASYVWGLDRRWQAVATAGRYQFHYSPLLATNGITWDELQLSGRGRIGQPWRVFATVGGADFSDGNSRVSLLSGFGYHWTRIRVTRLETGYAFQYIDYSEQLTNGYFDPSDFTAHLAQVRVNGNFAARDFSYRVEVDLGVQSFSQLGASVSNDPVAVILATLGIPVGAGFAVELYGGFGNYAAINPAGFETYQFGVRLRWSPPRK